MAKLWGRSQAHKAIQQSIEFAKIISHQIDAETHRMNNPKTNTPKLGIKSSVMIVYAEKGKLAAWQALQEYNKRISGGGFTLEMLENWIREYEKSQPQRMENDDRSDR